MEYTIEFELFPGRHLHVRLFSHVSNADSLREMILSNGLPSQCVLASSNAIVDVLHLRVAAHNALSSEAHGTMKTSSLSQELLFQLGSSRQIQRSLEVFGLKNDSESVVLAMFDATQHQLDQVTSLIMGRPANVNELIDRFDPSLVQKAFQLEDHEMRREREAIVAAVVSRVGCKDCFRS